MIVPNEGRRLFKVEFRDMEVVAWARNGKQALDIAMNERAFWNDFDVEDEDLDLAAFAHFGVVPLCSEVAREEDIPGSYLDGSGTGIAWGDHGERPVRDRLAQSLCIEHDIEPTDDDYGDRWWDCKKCGAMIGDSSQVDSMPTAWSYGCGPPGSDEDPS